MINLKAINTLEDFKNIKSLNINWQEFSRVVKLSEKFIENIKIK